MNYTRKLAVDILESIINKGSYSNIVINAELNKSNLDDRDKGLVTEIVYGTLKYKYTIDKILAVFLKTGTSKLDSLVLNVLRVSVYQIKYLDKVPDFAVVNEAVELVKKYKSLSASKLVNGVLRNYLRNKDNLNIVFKNKIDEICFIYSFDPWMVDLFVKQYGLENTEKILSGLNCTPNVTLRVNSLKTNYEDAYNLLDSAGYIIEEGAVCPEAIKIIKGKNIEQNPLFKEGFATVQDESAMLVAPSMDIKPDLTVLDLCSAPGGKTTHISEIMNNTGKVYAFDVHKDKLSLIKKNADRLAISNIEYGVLDSTTYDEKLNNTADRVLIDVPCSGLGIIRKKPEIKWTKNNNQLKDLVNIQKSIMNNASKYVKVGGVLMYSTCTLNKKENEENVKWFLSKFNNFSMESLFFGSAENIVYGEFGVTILPNESMDGFFIAKFKRLQ
ncbi:16S rRNA (cytosine(967)-C(5))-methyltransferase RsmB [Clostridium sp. YIM B02515]|uniref:16S rRNA (cytosine(967)-C(5))-methyltransferase n=1 Tax=Clostridium rhizosphaerae TaxID=2803861 RepID=A0ABS1T6I6_9CLOT|nr:16S rRNA (cytosine(967)-C(5))-methyltransferase RsmB [Clostridium rhizosphaerae]MBL4934950.1 16S rRNA (cytosine(967)-C(5))-methyltransferase RsmB [Clostridium rhizosphaerae]